MTGPVGDGPGDPPRIVLVGGGSGGHLFPAISVASELARAGGRVAFVIGGSPREAELIARAGWPWRVIAPRRLPDGVGWGWPRVAWSACTNLVRARRVLRQWRPAVVVGFGGAVSGVVVLAACSLGIPTVLHEQNAEPGRANRWLARWTSALAVSFPVSRRSLPARRVVLTGNPIRDDVVPLGRAEAVRRLGLDQGRVGVLVLGGSQGARALNELVPAAMGLLSPSVRGAVQVLHLAGERERVLVEQRYHVVRGVRARVFGFVHEMAPLYGAADVAITRAGATTVAELVAAGIPAVFIPYPYARAHQRANALVAARSGGGMVLEESAASPAVLRGVVERLVQDGAQRQRMAEGMQRLARPGAARRMMELVLEVAGAGRGLGDGVGGSPVGGHGAQEAGEGTSVAPEKARVAC